MRRRVMVAAPRNVAAVRGGAYPAVKEASMARREGTGCNGSGNARCGRESVKLGLLL